MNIVANYTALSTVVAKRLGSGFNGTMHQGERIRVFHSTEGVFVELDYDNLQESIEELRKVFQRANLPMKLVPGDVFSSHGALLLVRAWAFTGKEDVEKMESAGFHRNRTLGLWEWFGDSHESLTDIQRPK